MSNITITAQEGWARLVEAVAQAALGDEIVLEGGTFSGTETLRISQGISISAREGVRIEFSGRGPVILARNATGLALSGLKIEIVEAATATPISQEPPESAPVEDTPDERASSGEGTDSPSPAPGPVAVNDLTLPAIPSVEGFTVSFSAPQDGTGISTTVGAAVLGEHPDKALLLAGCDSPQLHDCSINAAGRRKFGLWFDECGEAQAEKLEFTGCDVAVMYWGSTGSITKSHCFKNRVGIEIHEAHHRDRKYRTSVEVRENRFHDNDIGISLLSSHSDAISGNECKGNRTGIALQRCEKGKDQPVSARIFGNTILASGENGIWLAGSDDTRVFENRVEGSGFSGIFAGASITFENRGRNLKIERNECRGNERGIEIAATSALVENNDCHDNTKFGILVTDLKPASPEGLDIRILSNRASNSELTAIQVEGPGVQSVSDNTLSGCELGILVTATAEMRQIAVSEIAENRVSDCYAGIILQMVGCDELRDNHVQGSQSTGIAILSSRCGRAVGNESKGNGKHGISFETSETTPDIPATGSALDNVLTDNTGSGLILISSDCETIAGNTCRGNGESGIDLRPAADSDRGSTCGTIKANMLVANGMCGLVLVSSSAGTVEENKCSWNERHGIELSNSEHALETRSSAILRGNKCGNNKQSGIILFSARSEAIEGNDCWGNGFDGIALQPMDERPKDPSTATITGNRLHHNNNGLRLYGSRADPISGNSVWGNKFDGISLRPFMPRRVPSTGRIVDNMISHNGDRGVVILGSRSEGIEGNWIIDNRVGIVFEDYDGDKIVKADQHGEVKGNVRPGNERYDKTSLLGALKLKGREHKHAAAMAGFLETPECARCFADAVLPKGDREGDGDGAGSGDSEVRKDHSRHLRIDFKQGDHNIVDISKGDRRPIAAVDDVLTRLQKRIGVGQAADPAVVALVSANDADIRQVTDLVQQADARARAPDKGNPAPAHPAVVADYGGRNGFDGTLPMGGLLESELLSKSKWQERFACIARLPELWLTVLLLVGGGAFAAFSGGSWTGLTTRIGEWAGFYNILWALALLLVGSAVVIGWLNIRLPSILRFRQGPLMWIAATANIIFSVVPHDLVERFRDKFGKTVSEKFVRPIEERAWFHWVSGKLRARGRGVHSVVLTHVESWAGQDRKRLERLLASGNGEHAFCLVLQLDGRASAFPLLLASQRDFGWPRQFELLLNDYDDELHIKPEDIEPESDTSGIDEALAKHFGGADETAIGELRGSLTDEEWWPIDLMPSLSIGSAPTGKFSIRRKAMLNVSTQLHEEIAAYHRVFEQGAPPRDWSDDNIRDLFRWAQGAPSIRVYQTRDRRREYERIAGRVGMRRSVARLIANLWQDEGETRDYLAAALKCSILAHQKTLAGALEQLSKDDNIDIAFRALDAILFLTKDLRSLDMVAPAGDGASGQIAEGWREVGQMFERVADEGEGGELALNLYPAFVSAWWNQFPDQCAECIEQDLTVVEQMLTGDTEPAAESTLRHSSLARLARQLRYLSFMETELARDTIARLLEQEWHRLPEPIAERVDAIVETVFADRRDLDQLLAQAPDEQVLELTASLHRRSPMKVLFHLAVAAVASLDAQSDARRSTDLLRIASNIFAVARAIQLEQIARLSVADLTEETRRMALNASAPTGDEPSRDHIAQFMAGSRVEQRLYQLLRPDLRPAPAIPFIIDRELDRLLLLTEAIVKRH